MHIIQQKLLKLIETTNIGNLPFREVGKIINEEHPQVIKYHLEQLEKRGQIKWNREKKIIQKVEIGAISNSDFVTIPILGSANCGIATIYSNEQIEGHLKVSKKLLHNKKNVFAIKAVGSSMNKANIEGKNIENGDYVVIDPIDKKIENNNYVLSIIDDVANIKKILFDLTHEQIILQSESSSSYPPIYIHASEASKFLVNGKIIQVIKKPRI